MPYSGRDNWHAYYSSPGYNSVLTPDESATRVVDFVIADSAASPTSGVSDFGTYIIPNYGLLSEAKVSLWPSGS